ncbi:IucA/IucC family protein [Guptibacillus algicola]|uniref:IucA/IucC family protein n=1 Tax=Guptibacillus algicola TaxID=225844 RepID=UPI001CD6225E|nr:IucA/IucC family protein [Alkalihalobacillus algicola]MCA0988545.1 IucA/IucC family siderophore biosynthesis protein [Alkalihalobacillus algicola]
MTIQMIKRPNHDVSKGFMLEAEVDCMRFIMKQMPSYLNYFIANLEKGRKGILHKLASSILRENINDLYKEAIDLKKVGSVFVVKSEKKNELSKAFYSHLQKTLIREELTYKVVQVKKGVLIFPIKHQYAFQRIETTDNILFIDDNGVSEIKVASELIQLLFEPGEQVELFITELDNGTANLALAYMFDNLWRKEIQDDAKELQATSTLDYLDKMSGNVSSSLFFEQLIIEGHHLHPGAKTKIGLSQSDVFRFSPEFHQSFGVRFVAVDREHVVTTAKVKRMLEEHYQEEWELCCAELEQKGLDPNKYDVIPVHEWQYEHAIPVVYEKELSEGTVILIEGVTLEAQATSSFRTVYAKNKMAPSLKLAVNSQMTSTVRSISTQTAMNSTLFTNMMTKIMKQEQQLKDFVPLNEIAGMAFKSDEELKSRNLTMLLRESIDGKLTEGEVAIAGPALYSRSPLSDQTILAELVNQFAKANNLTKSHAAFPFFDEYIGKVLPGYLTLMVKYGIALEGHLQNSIPVFKNGRLSRFFFRDWGGSRIYQARLDQQGIAVSFTPGSVSVTDNVSDMHNKLYYTVFQNHLGEVIKQLVQYSGISEEAFWKRVKKVCDHTFDVLSADSEENVSLDRSFMYQSTVMHKSLTKMRLSSKKGDSYCEVSNPLAHLVEDNG